MSVPRRIAATALVLCGLILLGGAIWFFQHLQPSSSLRKVVILYTNDEHGNIEASPSSGGAAGLFKLWRTRAGYTEDGPFLVLSGGDMWTGPAISTYFRGQSTIEVMNAMGYDAAALGNHDFDFGQEVVKQRAEQATFPFLSANIRNRETGNSPDFIRPYTLVEVNGVRVGVIGLTTVETPFDTQPSHVDNLRFLPYSKALEEIVPQVRAEGAELLVVIGHICESEMRALVPLAAELGITVLGGGHCHELVQDNSSRVILVQSGSRWDGYTQIELYVDKEASHIVRSRVRYYRNRITRGDPALADLISSWRQRLDAELGYQIGYVGSEIGRESQDMAALIGQAWLTAYPQAEVALISPRYLAQPLPAGPILAETMVSVLPTDNTLMDVVIPGEALVDLIEKHKALFWGLERQSGRYYLSNENESLDLQASYHVLLPRALYEGCEYYQVKSLALQAKDTGIDWRKAVIDWLLSLHTSPARPLEELLP